MTEKKNSSSTEGAREQDASQLEAWARQLQRLATRLRTGMDADADVDAEKARLAMRALGVILNGEPPTTPEADRDFLLGMCAHYGQWKYLRKSPEQLDIYVRTIVAVCSALATPAERKRLTLAAPKIRALVETHMKNTGGRGNRGREAVEKAQEALMKAIGYPAKANSVRRSKTRRKAKTKAR